MTLRRVPPAAWLVIAGFLICAAINLPGHLSYDSIMQLNEGRRGFYANWHPPMMSWLLGVFDWVSRGTALFTIFDMALFFGSLGALVWLSSPAARGRWHATQSRDGGGDAKLDASIAVLAVMFFTPQVLLYEGIVWKDVLFANLSIAGFVALAVAGEKWERARLRFSLLVVAFLLLSVATLVRQNGGVVLPAGVAALAWIAWQKSSAEKIRATFALRRFRRSSERPSRSSPCMRRWLCAFPATRAPPSASVCLQFYDLIGAIKTKPALELPYFEDDDTDARAIDADGRRQTLHARAQRHAGAIRSACSTPISNSPEETIPEEWHRLIAVHTGLYLRVRA